MDDLYGFPPLECGIKEIMYLFSVSETQAKRLIVQIRKQYGYCQGDNNGHKKVSTAHVIDFHRNRWNPPRDKKKAAEAQKILNNRSRAIPRFVR
jgi:hypothetical protein